MVRNYIRKTDRGMTYSKEKLIEAVGKVRSGEMNGYEASNVYNIPRTTLYDYIKGKSKKSSTLGKPPALAPELEKVIAENLLALEENGFYFGRKELLDLVGLYLNENKISHPFKSGKPGECWLSSFSKRRNVAAKPIYKEFGNPDKEVLMVKEFYSTIEKRIDELKLTHKPGQIWHVEEHSFYKGKRVHNYDKEKDITIVTVFSAEGRKAPLLTVFQGEERHDWMLGKHVNVSHKNGMCREVFKNYFTTVFLNYIDDSKQNLVIFEGQSSLIDLDVIEKGRKVKVTMVKAPHYLENLDISIARTLKAKFDQVFGDSTKEFATVMAQLFDDLQETDIGLDFKNAGVHPFEAVCDTKFTSDRLIIYDEYKWFRQKHLENMRLNKDTEQVTVREDSEFQMDFEIESDSSSSMWLTDEAETPSRYSGDMLKRALLSVKKGLMLHEEEHNYDRELTKAEEDHLVAWVMDLTKAGFKITEDYLMDAVNNIQGNPNMMPDRCKYECFLKSYPKLKYKLSKEVSVKVTPESINLWLYHTRMYLKKHNVGDVMCHPRRIFNFGEIILSYSVEDQDKGNNTYDDLTVYVTASADGNVQAPSVIFPFKPIGSCAWSKAEILNDQITDVFYDWLIKHKIQFPVVLFLDQMTHINVPLFKFCKENKIILLALPNTQIQPLEAIFRPLKQFWNENFALKKLKKEDLAKILENYTTQDFSKEIPKRFKLCGLYPFNTNIEYNMKATETNLQNAEKSKEFNQINLLDQIEKRITNELLEKFKKSGDAWKGDPRDFSLFLFWKNIHDENKGYKSDAEDNSDAFVEIFVEQVNASVAVCKGSDMLM